MRGPQPCQCALAAPTSPNFRARRAGAHPQQTTSIASACRGTCLGVGREVSPLAACPSQLTHFPTAPRCTAGSSAVLDVRHVARRIAPVSGSSHSPPRCATRSRRGAVCHARRFLWAPPPAPTWCERATSSPLWLYLQAQHYNLSPRGVAVCSLSPVSPALALAPAANAVYYDS